MDDTTIALVELLRVVTLFLLPLLAVWFAVPRFRAAGAVVANYRGRPVALGLVVAWVTWALVAAAESLYLHLPDPWPQLLLVLGVAGLGTLDDLLGDRSIRGFRGHLAALRKGRVTTGAVKLFGIGAISLAVGVWIARPYGASSLQTMLVRGLLGGLAIALTANLVNLLDLRPGRALKGYSALVVLVAACAWVPVAVREGPATLAVSLLAEFALALLLLAPVVACWRLDLAEIAMLGDGGANAAGAVVGFAAAQSLSTPALIVWVLVALALNLASERVSFSAVIERTPPLRWLDMLGRLPAQLPPAQTSPSGESGSDSSKE